jgi:uncharacterized OB-fold protein
MIASLKRAVSGDELVCECRRCGTTVSPGTDRCPECESTDIVRYSF